MVQPNYVDPDFTRPVDLGPCRCPVEPRPHDRDSADVVALFGEGQRGKIRQAGRLGGAEAFKQMAILLGVKRWSLVLPNGSARPIDAEQIERLDEGTVELLLRKGALDEAFDEDELPKLLGARLPSGSSASASQARTTRRRRRSTST